MRRSSPDNDTLGRILVAVARALDRDTLASALGHAGFREELGFHPVRARGGGFVTARWQPTRDRLSGVKLLIADRRHFTAIDNVLEVRSGVSLLLLDREPGESTHYNSLAGDFAAVGVVPEDASEDTIAAAAARVVSDARTRRDRVLLWIIDDDLTRFAPGGPWEALIRQAEKLPRNVTALCSWLPKKLDTCAAAVVNAWAENLVRPARCRGTPMVVVADNVLGRGFADGGQAWCETLRPMLPEAALFVVSATNRPAFIDLGIRTFSLLNGHSLREADMTVVCTAVEEAVARPRPAHDVGYVQLPRPSPLVDGIPLYGVSTGIRKAVDDARSLSGSKAAVLIQGPSGTGKELIAGMIHKLSGRDPFVSVNCSAIPSPLAESEFFGHNRGAFTDATADKEGLFEAARGGTLFLDEIGELPKDVQPKLLRALESGTIRRIGSTENVDVDVRVVSATKDELEGGTFREDLYYRLRVGGHIRIPALRERPDDIPVLVAAWAPAARVTHGAMQLLQSAEWPGNVRQLKSAVEGKDVIDTISLPQDIGGGGGHVSFQDALSSAGTRLRALALSHEELGGEAAAAALAVGSGAARDAARALVRMPASLLGGLRREVWNLLEWEESLAAELADGVANGESEAAAAIRSLAAVAGDSMIADAERVWLDLLAPSAATSIETGTSAFSGRVAASVILDLGMEVSRRARSDWGVLAAEVMAARPPHRPSATADPLRGLLDALRTHATQIHSRWPPSREDLDALRPSFCARYAELKGLSGDSVAKAFVRLSESIAEVASPRQR